VKYINVSVGKGRSPQTRVLIEAVCEVPLGPDSDPVGITMSVEDAFALSTALDQAVKCDELAMDGEWTI